MLPAYKEEKLSSGWSTVFGVCVVSSCQASTPLLRGRERASTSSLRTCLGSLSAGGCLGCLPQASQPLSQAWKRENKGVLPLTWCSSSSTFPLHPISSSSQLPPRTGEGLVSSLWRKLEPSPGSHRSWQHRGDGTPKSQPTLERSAYPTIYLHLLELAYLFEGQEPQLNPIVVLWDVSAKSNLL